MTQRDRLMITVVATLVLLAGYWMLLLTPKREEAADAETQVNVARQTLTTAQQRLSTGQEAQKRFRRDRATVLRLGRVLPASDDTPTVLTQLDAIARKHDITFTSYAIEGGGDGGSAASAAPAPTTPAGQGEASSTAAVAPLYPPGSSSTGGGLGRTPLKIELTGTYFDLERFLRDVQRFAVMSAKGDDASAKGRLFVVDGVNYQPDPAKAGRLKAELYASTYFAPSIEAPATPDPGTGTGAAPVTPATSGTAAIGGLR